MKKTVFIIAALLSAKAFAIDSCVNLSGYYKLQPGGCQALSTSAEAGVKFQDFAGGPDEVRAYQGSVIRIEQNDCNSFKLTRVNGQMQNNGQYRDVSYTYSSGTGKTLSADTTSISFTSLFIRGVINKSESMKLTKTTKGIAVSYIGKILTFAYIIPSTNTDRSSCELTKIP